jgi:hypothetical protein
MRRAACAPGLCWAFLLAVDHLLACRFWAWAGFWNLRAAKVVSVMCGVSPTKRREGLGGSLSLCLEKGGGCVLLLLPLRLYVKLLLTLCSTPSLSYTSCFVRSCLAGYRTLNSLLRAKPPPLLHCDSRRLRVIRAACGN